MQTKRQIVIKNWRKTLGVLCLCVCLAGCGDSNNGSTAGSINLAGTWQIYAESMLYNFSYSGTAALQQNGNSVTGTINFSGTPCATTATVSGTLSGTSVSFQVMEGSQAVSLTGTVSYGTSMIGTYTAPSGGCTDGDYGTWSASKTS